MTMSDVRKSSTASPIAGWRTYARGVLGYGPALFGVGVVLTILVVSLAAPWIAPHEPRAIVGPILEAPSSAHWFGTDILGRDVYSGVIYGGRISLLIGFTTVAMVLVIGVPVGALAGYYGGWVDATAMRLAEVFQVVPSFVLALVFVALLGDGVLLISFAIALAIWPQTARLVRAEFLRIKQLDLVAAARTAGFRDRRIIFREMLPNGMAPLVVQTTIDVGLAILIGASLNFLGLGDPAHVTWGAMLNRAQQHLSSWWLAVPPGLCILLVVLAINFIGDGLNASARSRITENL